jgi:hypothetical protein
MTKHPANDWKFVDDIEEEFVNWFTGNYGEFSFRYEWFFGDCEVEDEKIRKDLMYKWVHSAYVSGYNAAMKPHGGTE